MKKIAIRKNFSYFYTNSIEIASGGFDDKLEALDLEMKALLKKYGIEGGLGHTTFYGLEKYSICNCEQCGHLMVNRDQNPAGFSGNELVAEIEYLIYDGGELEGKKLCEECLPFTHRWGHHS
jgi:hypothetical protein